MRSANFTQDKLANGVGLADDSVSPANLKKLLKTIGIFWSWCGNIGKKGIDPSSSQDRHYNRTGVTGNCGQMRRPQ